MSNKEAPPYENILREFSFGDQKRVEAKVKRFTTVGRGKMHILFDFDRTLTFNSEGEDVTSWHILRSHLPQEGQKQYDSFFQKYRTLEIQKKLTQADAILWWEQILSLAKEHEVNMMEVERDFLSKANARPYAQELFRLCQETGIPTVILSAGIADFINIWCSRYGIAPKVILSTKLSIGEGGKITGWEEKTLVHVLNKKEMGHSELTRIRTTHPFTVLIGDGLEDANMIEGVDDVIRVRINDPRKDEPIDRLRKETFERFDLMIENGSLQPVLSLVSLISK